MHKKGSRLTALSMFLCFTTCFTLTAFAKETVPSSGRASDSDASKPAHDKVQHTVFGTGDTASPSDMETGTEFHLFCPFLMDDNETFGFSIRKTGTDGALKDEATFRLYRTYDDAVADKNAIYFMADDSYETYTACGSDGCDYGSISGKDIYAGLAEVEGLPNETYYLAEVMAPEGYEKITYILEIVLEDDGSVYYREMPHGTDFTQADEGLLTIENRAILAMPGTGGSSNTLRYVAAAVLILSGMGFLKVKTGKHSEE